MRQRLEYLRASLCAALALAAVGAAPRAPGGAAEPHEAGAWPAMRALGREFAANRGEVAPERRTDDDTPPQHEPAGVLTLRRALELALLQSPDLAAAAHGVRAAEGNVRQAGGRPNPELELEVEEFGGTGDRKGYDAAETSVQLSQALELGGKRAKRQRTARSEARLAGWDYEAKRLDVLTETRKAFVDVLLAQGQLALTGSLLALAGDVQRAAAERVRSGKVSPLEETKAAIEVAAARIARDRAGRELDTARRRLAAAWGGTTPVFKEAVGDLEAVGDVPPVERLSELAADAPEVMRWNAEVARAGESVALAAAARIPDIGIHAGINRFEEDGTYAGIAGLSVTLPLFDNPAGGLAAARQQAARAEYERRAAHLRALTDLAEAHSRLETARSEALATKEELLPGARQAFEAAQTGYREGKYGHLDVLDAQRTLSEAQARYLDVLAAFHKAAADVERLTGTPLDTIR